MPKQTELKLDFERIWPGGVDHFSDAAKKPPLGSGGRFAALKAKIAAKGNVRDPGAVAAAIGRAKYGKKKFQALAAKGKKGA
jgi:hypothetical protein